MAAPLKTLETVKKALKPKPQKPKLTPAQFKQKAKLEASMNKVIQGSAISTELFPLYRRIFNREGGGYFGNLAQPLSAKTDNANTRYFI